MSAINENQIINELIDTEIFFRLDELFARSYLQGDLDESKILVLCFLMAVSRHGHLCFSIQGDQLTPSLDSLLLGEVDKVPEALIIKCSQMILEGSQSLPTDVVCDIQEESYEITNKPVIKKNNCFYLHKNFGYEKKILELLYERMNYRTSLFDSDVISALIQEKGSQLLPQQQNAVIHALTSVLTFIAGGPGTGKTYTASKLIDLLLQLMPEAKVAITAPTGKAAYHLATKIDQTRNIDIQTLHSFLGIKKKNSSLVDYDLVIIDEASMMDAKIMLQLLKQVPLQASLVIMGDPDQLPPIETGAIFSDLCRFSKIAKEFMVQLSTAKRFEDQALIQFADFTNKMDLESLTDLLNQKSNFFNKQNLDDSFFKQSISFYQSSISISTAIEALNFFNRIRILSPFKKGSFGVQKINLQLHSFFSSHTRFFPIVITKNAAKYELFNGMTGVYDKEKDLFYFSSANGDIIEKSSLIVPSYEIAYALSIHKSQGSEFEHILLVLPSGCEIFGKKMLYTAVTRAKKEITFFGEDNIFGKILSKNFVKVSGVHFS
ncbi:MAG TPA: exodeoxyribonuclease V subunit alpha [Chlamydiales bacterium]|nr:exodeoxyribonuclease V subunit alpha [Chlamydiales bacterium]